MANQQNGQTGYSMVRMDSSVKILIQFAAEGNYVLGSSKREPRIRLLTDITRVYAVVTF